VAAVSIIGTVVPVSVLGLVFISISLQRGPFSTKHYQVKWLLTAFPLFGFAIFCASARMLLSLSITTGRLPMQYQ
jgi:hypothetical protein